MPTAEFKTTSSCPSVPSRESAEVVLANITKYLTFSDTTGIFDYHAVISEVRLAPSKDSAVLYWKAPVSSTADIQKINNEMSNMAHVRHHECVSNPNL